MSNLQAILLLGPTGSGKTPLGDCLAARGLWGRRCWHFDFGAQLRAAAGSRPAELGPADLAVIENVLTNGALLEDHQFPIARRILESFIRINGCKPDDLIVLNGMPRHTGQARDVARIVQIVAVISLECPAEVVYQRIGSNTGGDRAGRVDDDVAAIARKLELYRQRTTPLIDHYRELGVKIIRIAVGVNTTALEAWHDCSAI